MPTLFISRHEGAKQWIKSQQVVIDRFETHLEIDKIVAGDTVIGTLPVQLAAQVCAKGARYLHLTVDLLETQRGIELSEHDLATAGTQLQRFFVSIQHG